MRRSLLAGLVLAIACGVDPSRAAGSVTVVVGAKDSGPYRAASEGLRAALQKDDARTVVRTRTADPLRGVEDARGWLLEDRPAVIVTLGSVPFGAVADLKDRPPVVACMVLRPGDLEGRDDVTGVHLQFPAREELQWISRLAPDRRRVGVLYNPAENRRRIEEAGEAAKALGLEWVAVPVESPTRLPEALDAVTRSSDVLWAIPDSVALRGETAQTVLLSALRRKVPVAGASEAWAQAGAMWAVDRDYADIGRQCAEQVIAILGGARAASLPPASPRRSRLSLNLRSAALLGVAVPPKLAAEADEVFR